MTVSPHSFPPRQRRPSAASFLSPKLSGADLLRALHSLSTEISLLRPPRHLFLRFSAAILRKSHLLSVIFADIDKQIHLSHTSILCFEELYITLQRIKALIEDCSNGSRMWLLMQCDSISSTFHELTLDLWTLLEIFPTRSLNLSDDVEELKDLIIKQCCDDKTYLNTIESSLRIEVLIMLDSIRKEIVPEHSRLAEIFTKLGLSDSASCREEIEFLEDEIQSENDEKSKSDLVALIGLVRYTKCVLFGASSPASDIPLHKTTSFEMNLQIPTDFRCPITLDMMRDPVVVATGQTYDRQSITMWIESGHDKCPKTGQTLAHTNLIPNRALKSLIAMWCRDQKIPLPAAADDGGGYGVTSNKAALEATKMTVTFLLDKLLAAPLTENTNRIVYELRVLAKTDSDSRACIGEAGAIPLLVRLLGSEHPHLQVNAVTTILNLSILDVNKSRIMGTDGALNGVIQVLRSGATWEAKANAAATIFSLSGLSSHRKRLGRKTRVVHGLVDLAREGPVGSKRDALVAISSLAGDRDTVGKLIDGGVVGLLAELLDELPEEVAVILEMVVKKGGVVAVVAVRDLIGKLATMLRSGTDRARESAVATLVTICRKGGADMVAAVARLPSVEVAIWELMSIGTTRAKRKATSLMRIIRRWVTVMEGDIAEELSMAILGPQ